MSCALTKLVFLEDSEPVLENCREHLSKAVFLMDAYDKTWHSIIWIRSNSATKKRTQQRLDELAFDAFQHFRQATENLNLYVDVLEERHTNGQEVLIPQWWDDMLLSLLTADSIFRQENKHQIIGKQLRLF
ncbi:MAG: hypothetical protein NHB32_31755 [Fischerella sp. CENA71]|nr:hypothetical protein [Fischerella sp. CENA71]